MHRGYVRSQLFELPMSKYNETSDTRTELQLLKRLWDTKELVRFSYDDWQTALWNDVNTEVLEDKNKKLSAQLKRFGDSNPIVKGWQVQYRISHTTWHSVYCRASLCRVHTVNSAALCIQRRCCV